MLITIRVSLICILLLCELIGYSQSMFGINRQQKCVLGTSTPYYFPQHHITPPPKGYKLIYINHVGRHGSRYPTSSDDIDLLIKTLTNAKEEGMLKTHGKKLLKEIRALRNTFDNKWGLLSSLGVEQWNQIGARIHSTFPTITDGTVILISDVMERCQKSMLSCLDGIYARGEKRNIYTYIIPYDNDLLNFFKVNQQYKEFRKNMAWQEDLSYYKDKQLNPTLQLKSIFKRRYIQQHPDSKRIALALYNTYTITHDVPQAKVPDIGFTNKQMRRTWHVENAWEYMSKGPYPGYNEVQINIAYPLLEDFLCSAAQAVSSDTLTATLRFAHAETLIPFSALMGIPMASQQSNKLNKIHRYWQDSNVAPMAANIQWLFYRNAEGHCLVKILLNEREVAIPIYTNIYPYYQWDEVQAYYMNRTKEAKIQLNH